MNEKGQVIAQSQVMKDLEKTVKIEEEKGLTCCICREGYENEPKKVSPAHCGSTRVSYTSVCVCVCVCVCACMLCILGQCFCLFFPWPQLLGVYTFTKRCNVDEFERKPRKTQGFCTVTHFNVIHYDCHTSAVM